MTPMQPLPGFRDFLPRECAVRNYIFAKWREVARRYGFVEWDGPVLEPTGLYRKKSGDEIVSQLFNFTDKGEREVAMRPELTPSLARVIAAHEREFKKPLKWFSIGQFYRYEKQQRGRLREHYQLNCDIIGETSIDADVEIISLAIDLLRAFGLSADDFTVRISDREAWAAFLNGWNIPEAEIPNFLSIIDRLDRVGEEETKRRVEQFCKIEWHDVKVMLENPADGARDVSPRLDNVLKKLTERGLDKFVQLDCSLVRGLAYYTGTVFEIFDRARKLRALAGGGRYDRLIQQLSDGAVDLPALGFAMGDVVLGELIRDHPEAGVLAAGETLQMDAVDIYVVIAKEERRADAVARVQHLRESGYRVDYPLGPAKVGKQFQTAGELGARIAILFGDEWPQLKFKDLRSGEQSLVPNEELSFRVATLLSSRG